MREKVMFLKKNARCIRCCTKQCKHITQNKRQSPMFSHDAWPMPESLTKLCRFNTALCRLSLSARTALRCLSLTARFPFKTAFCRLSLTARFRFKTAICRLSLIVASRQRVAAYLSQHLCVLCFCVCVFI